MLPAQASWSFYGGSGEAKGYSGHFGGNDVGAYVLVMGEMAGS